mmetsp:Transcript_18013/g.44833  ORF Transcript_18013/g.44833 Transcript_18013/m.44833 type:complete len:365 (-) Transcript_18013:66-1160(-)
MTVPAAAKSRAQRTFSKLLLVLSASALLSTLLAKTSGDIVLQVLSQTELVQTNRQAKTNSSTHRIAINHEPYGYVSIKDDTGKPGALRFLSRASFYEYRLPRAILRVSQHKEELTLEESEELQFRSGLIKRPWFWDPSLSDRNVFVDEPYRDKNIDRLFKWSNININTSLVVGILSVVGLLFLSDRINGVAGYNTKCLTLHDACCHRPRIWISKAAGSLLGTFLRKDRKVLVAFALKILVGLVAVAGVMPATAIAMLLNNDTFCGKRCASSSLDASVDLQVDACIEGCLLGKGGKFAVLASCLWFLVLLLILAIASISFAAAKLSSSSLSRRQRWNTFLPLAISPEQLFHPSLELPLSHDRHQQ